MGIKWFLFVIVIGVNCSKITALEVSQSIYMEELESGEIFLTHSQWVHSVPLFLHLKTPTAKDCMGEQDICELLTKIEQITKYTSLVQHSAIKTITSYNTAAKTANSTHDIDYDGSANTNKGQPPNHVAKIQNESKTQLIKQLFNDKSNHHISAPLQDVKTIIGTSNIANDLALAITEMDDLFRKINLISTQAEEASNEIKHAIKLLVTASGNMDINILQNAIMSSQLDAIFLAFCGFLPVQWLPTGQLQYVLRDVAANLPNGLRTLRQYDDTFYYTVPIVDKVEVLDGMVYLHMKIPIKVSGSSYKLYKVQKSPAAFGANINCEIQLETDFVLFDETSGSYFEVDESFVTECMTMNICEIGKYNYRLHPQNDCLLNVTQCILTCTKDEGYHYAVVDRGCAVVISGNHTATIHQEKRRSSFIPINPDLGNTKYFIGAGYVLQVDEMFFHGPLTCNGASYLKPVPQLPNFLIRETGRDNYKVVDPNNYMLMTLGEAIETVVLYASSEVSELTYLRLCITVSISIICYFSIYFLYRLMQYS